MSDLTNAILQKLRQSIADAESQIAIATKTGIKPQRINEINSGKTNIANVPIRNFEKLLPVLKNLDIVIDNKIYGTNKSVTINGNNNQLHTGNGDNIQGDKTVSGGKEFTKLEQIEKEVLSDDSLDSASMIKFLQIIKKYK